jgi:hypothetical protein
MPKPIKIRTSYHADAAFLHRLAQAVEMDTHRPLEWRKKVIAAIQQLTMELAQAPERIPPRQGKA